MFLKRIELSGFKSFAQKTVISFEQPLTGIVGPNGCGKSNITDAVRWVLGEQSAKSLRSGSSISDIIFAGSQSRKPVNTARATLVFDNSQKIFDSPFEEIEITRQISRGSSEIANFINKTPVRLKDIQDLVMDTGLGRDSLSIISQGNISSFADAKPEERRLLFEEAAGVAKYKKRKKISLSKLDSVHSNLERVQDLIDACAQQLESLEEQAQKAVEYTECRDELSRIEISVLVMRIRALKQEEQKTAAALSQASTEQISRQRALEKAEEEAETLQKRIFELDGLLSALQSERSDNMEESMQLQKQKAILDERRKVSLNSEDEQKRRQSLIELYTEARYEYEDREKRLHAADAQVQSAENRLASLNAQLAAGSDALAAQQDRVHALKNELAGIESRIAHPPYRNQGVQAVMKHARQIGGIHGLVRDLLSCEEAYLPAIVTALSSASEQIVVDSEKDARAAIGWLKKTKAGRATFLPLSVCRPRTLQSWQEQTARRQDGILGTADSFVSCEAAYEPLRGRLLGNVLLARDLEAANAAARALKQSVKIVTLGGDVVHSGGAMTGGSFRQPSNPLPALKQEKSRLEAQIEQHEQALESMKEDVRVFRSQVQSQNDLLLHRRIDREKLASIAAVKKEKFESLQIQAAQFAPQTSAESLPGSSENELVSRLSALHARQDAVSSQIELYEQEKAAAASRQSDLQSAVRQGRRDLTALSAAIQKYELDKARLETRMEQDLLRLGTDYTMTYEAACRALGDDFDESAFAMDEAEQRVRDLRRRISQLGNVNLQAPEQLQEVRNRHTFLTSQKQELEDASKQILDAVDEMDQTMTVQFETMFNRINECLDEVFQAMFGGGHARLVLCDPQDLLNTGVDVDVQPPGKSIKNLQTFSGGEKALIAISVLFAILKARTVPLCIFDEAEAALDQANVERFARYLSHFKDQSQFITVTHRPGTMEQCDTLYGITMQKDGVSQVLKVLLRDAREMGR